MNVRESYSRALEQGSLLFTEASGNVTLSVDAPCPGFHEVLLLRHHEPEGGGGRAGAAAARGEGALLLLPIPPKSQHLESVGRKGLHKVGPSPRYRVTHLLADWAGSTWIWDVPLSCLGSTAAAVLPNGLWNIPHQSQLNPGQRGDGSPCTASWILLCIT